MKFAQRFPELIAKLPDDEFRAQACEIEILEFGKDDLSGLAPNNTVLIGKGVSNHDVYKACRDFRARHFIDPSREDFFFELISSALMLKNPTRFVSGDRPFLLYDFLQKAGAQSKLNSQSISFNNSYQKPEVLDQISHFLSQSNRTEELTTTLLQIADELMTNALYHAPTNNKGEHIYEEMARTDYVEYYNSKRPAKIFIYYNDKKLLIGCDDPYGSLEPNRLLNRLVEVHHPSGKVKPISDKHPGLGFKFMTDNSMSMYVIIKPKVHTTVACSFDLTKGYRRIEGVPKHFHFCFY